MLNSPLILDGRIDLIPSLPLFLSIVCRVIHLAYRHTESQGIMDSQSPHDMPLIIFQLTSSQIPKGHVPNVEEFYPRTHSADTRPETHSSHPHSPYSNSASMSQPKSSAQ